MRRPEHQLAAMVLHGRIPAGPEPTPESIDWTMSTWRADAYLDELEAVRIKDPWCAEVIATVVELRRLGRPADPVSVHEAMVDRSPIHRPCDAVRLLELDPEPYTMAAIPLALEAIAADDLREQLVGLVAQLDRPGAVHRVAAQLGRTA